MSVFTNNSGHHGDLALIRDSIQVCLEEIGQLLSLQHDVHFQGLSYDFGSAIDTRLTAISTLNKLAIECVSINAPKFSFDSSVSPKSNSDMQNKCLKTFIGDATQNMELICNIKRYIQDKSIKYQFGLVIQRLKQANQDLEEKVDLIAEEQEGNV